MRGKIVKNMMMLAIIAGLLAATFAMPSVSAQGTVLAVPYIVDTSKTPGTTFSIDITVDDVEFMFGYEFILRFAPSVLQAIDFVSYDPFSDVNPVYIGEGYISSAANYPIPEYFGLWTTDPVPLGSVTFKVIGEGLTELELYYTVVVDVYGKLIEHTVGNSMFSNIVWTEPYTVAVKLDSAFVESRFFKISKEEDVFQTITGQFENVGTVGTCAELTIKVFDSMGAKIADLTSIKDFILPGQKLRLSSDLNAAGLELKPATYLVEVGVKYISAWDYSSHEWTSGRKGDVTGHRTTMELSFKVED